TGGMTCASWVKKQDQGIDIVENIFDMGFEASLYNVRDVSNLDHRDTTRKWRNSFFISLIFGVPSMILMMYFMFTMDMDHEKTACKFIDGLSMENFLLFLLSTPVQ
ncbi:unnamed protein product, partial [Allacma fusca]